MENNIHIYDVKVNNDIFKVIIDNSINSIRIQGVYTEKDNVHSIVLGYKYNLEEDDEILFLSDSNKVVINKDESKFVYNQEEFKLETTKDREFATKVLLYENYNELKNILNEIDKYEVTEEFNKKLENSIEDNAVKEYIAMKKDSKLKELLKKLDIEA